PAMRPAACARDATGVSLRCLIVDDNAYFLEAAASLLEREGLTVAGVASDSADALRLTRELRPVIVLISTHAEADFADLIQEAPVAGFVPKSELSASAIRQLAGA